MTMYGADRWLLSLPFLIMEILEAETMDDLDTPVIVYASPSFCQLLGYDMVRRCLPCPPAAYPPPYDGLTPSTWGDSMSWTAFSFLLWVRRRLRL
jgi:hypothetical protein